MRVTAIVLGLGLVLGAILGAPTTIAEPTPGLGCAASAAGAPLPRIVPDPEYALDYISFDEWKVCLDLLNKTAPDYIEPKVIGQSAGWKTATGGRTHWPVYAVEVTNEKSAIAFEDKLKVAFILSIHGNEKGGREGGFRVIEDLARGNGIAQEYPDLRTYLDYMVAVFVFPNPDGWTREDAAVFLGNPGTTTGFTRGNGNGSDLNRQWPNHGWTNEAYKTQGQPELVATVRYLKSMDNWAYGTDIHGMQTPSDARMDEYQKLREGAVPRPGGSLLMGMLSAGQADPREHLKSTRVGELLKERVNKDPQLAEWSTAPNLGAWGGQVMEWGTSWDTIGYVDSGFTGDFFVQDHGLNAGDMDFELSYNHGGIDNHYTVGLELNRLHVRCVRQIVAVFLQAASTDVQVSYETQGTRTAYLFNPKVVSNRDPDGAVDELTGWAASNPNDDAFDYAHVDYEARPNDYFVDVQRIVRDGDKPGVLDSLNAGEIDAARLARYDQLVVAGSSIEQLDPAGIQDIKAWVEAGGRLILTDQSLRMLSDFGLVPADKLTSVPAYAGHTNFVDSASPFLKGLRGLARQTYEAVPIGYEPGRAPIWSIDAEAWRAAGGTAIGKVALNRPTGGASPTTLLLPPTSGPTAVNLGEASLGKGTIRVLGALLPDPTEEFYHPYGLDGYATTYTGNLLLRNMLGWEETYAAPPVILESLGTDRAGQKGAGASFVATPSDASTPGPTFLLAMMALVVLACARRR